MNVESRINQQTLPPLVVMTDLDGTLLDHHTYSYTPAIPVLARLKAADIPLILNTSKTAAELEIIRKELENSAPYVVENGSAVFIPAEYFDGELENTAQKSGYYMHVLGALRSEILELVHKIRIDKKFLFTGFADMEVSEVIVHTGLSETDAILAATREFSEPLIWQDSARQLLNFEALIANHGLRLLKGGRFVHVIGACDKGKCLHWLRERFTNSCGARPAFVALGDSQNDVAMLNAADTAVIVRSSQHEPPVLEKRSSIIITEKIGPQGWADALTQILDEALS